MAPPDAGRFRLVPGRSKIWCDSETDAHPIYGVASEVNGFFDLVVVNRRLEFTVAPRGRVELEVERLRSGNWFYDSEMKRLVGQRHPRIIGELREVKPVDEPTGRYLVSGELSFFGATLPVEGEVTITFVDDRTLVVEGTKTFNVRDFGMEPPTFRVVRVKPEVRVRIRLFAERMD